MENKRRQFLKLSGLTWFGITRGGALKEFASVFDDHDQSNINLFNSNTCSTVENKSFDERNLSIIGLYGEWANALNKINCLIFLSEGRNG